MGDFARESRSLLVQKVGHESESKSVQLIELYFLVDSTQSIIQKLELANSISAC